MQIPSLRFLHYVYATSILIPVFICVHNELQQPFDFIPGVLSVHFIKCIIAVAVLMAKSKADLDILIKGFFAYTL